MAPRGRGSSASTRTGNGQATRSGQWSGQYHAGNQCCLLRLRDSVPSAEMVPSPSDWCGSQGLHELKRKGKEHVAHKLSGHILGRPSWEGAGGLQTEKFLVLGGPRLVLGTAGLSSCSAPGLSMTFLGKCSGHLLLLLGFRALGHFLLCVPGGQESGCQQDKAPLGSCFYTLCPRSGTQVLSFW